MPTEPSAAQDLGKCLLCGGDNDYPLAAVCTSCQKKSAASPYAMPVTLDGETFASLVGRENRDVYLFRVSEAWLDAMGDNEWHGPVEWRIAREEGRIVTLEMWEVRLVEAD